MKIKFFSILSLIVIFISYWIGPVQSQGPGSGPILSLNTYYPSPFGVYQVMRLYPGVRSGNCTADRKGAIYYDDGTADPEGLYVCDGTAWVVLSNFWEHRYDAGTLRDYLYPQETSWYVGIGLENPATALQVNGAISRSGATVTDPTQINLGGKDVELSVTEGLYSTIGGGSQNKAQADGATVSGGQNNRALELQSTVGGGGGNWATGVHSTISGGLFNKTDGMGDTIGGGITNQTDADGSTIGGGNSNIARGAYATVAGGMTNISSGQNASIGGGQFNTSAGQSAVIAGGSRNTASGESAVIAGGNANTASREFAVIGGGSGNIASDQFAIVVGGESNQANGVKSFVGGGTNNIVSGPGGAIITGKNNQAALGAFVGSGQDNVAAGIGAFIGSGMLNQAEGRGSFIGAGQSNVINVLDNSIGNSILGGMGNVIENTSYDLGGATISGGTSNRVTAEGATVSGGGGNTASGVYSWAGGYNAFAHHNGSFVWSDKSSAAEYESNGENTFNVRAKGGFYLGKKSSWEYKPGDITEFMNVLSVDHLQGAELVSTAVDKKLGKTKRPYDPGLIGVVSSKRTAAFYMGNSAPAFEDTQAIPIALVGQVYLKVTNESGPIDIGDPITSSSTPGLGMKAGHSGKIVGYSLEGENFADGDTSEILIFVNLSYYHRPEEFVSREEFERVLAELKALKE